MPPKRHYPRHSPSAVKELLAYLKTRWKLFTFGLAGVATVFTSVGAISKNWDAVEPSFISTRGFVRDSIKVAQQTQTGILRDLQIESAEGKRSQASNAVANWKLEKLKTKDPVTQSLIDQQIINQEAEVDRLSQQLKTLNRLKQQGH